MHLLVLREWQLFQGNVFIKTPGYYTSLATFDNSVSSARALPPQETNAILLFEHGYYAGRMVVLYSSHQELPLLDFNDKISSVIVTGGTWTVYEHTVYHGHSKTIGQGYYPQSPLGKDTISSVINNWRIHACSTKENSVSRLQIDEIIEQNN